MKLIKDFGKGICIGVANVIPGFSGGTMAVILKVYERLVNALGMFFSHPIQVIKDIWSLFLGIIAGVIFSLFTVTKLLAIFPVPTVLFFVGLIIGSIPNIHSESKKYQKLRFFDIIGFIIACAIIIILPIINKTEVEIESINFLTIIIVFVVGVIASASMVIPGVSGSLVLMAFGYYLIIMNSLKDFITKFFSFEFEGLFPIFSILFTFGVGCIIGIVYISKLITLMFKRQPKLTYSIILGLLIASPFAIIYSVVNSYSDILNLNNPWISIIGVIFMILGIVISGFLPRWFNEKD